MIARAQRIHWDSPIRYRQANEAKWHSGTIENFSSSGITDAGQIIKDGTSSLTFNVANTFSGGLTINKGEVIATANGALGTGNVSLTATSVTLTLAGGTSNYINTIFFTDKRKRQAGIVSTQWFFKRLLNCGSSS